MKKTGSGLEPDRKGVQGERVHRRVVLWLSLDLVSKTLFAFFANSVVFGDVNLRDTGKWDKKVMGFETCCGGGWPYLHYFNKETGPVDPSPSPANPSLSPVAFLLVRGTILVS